MTDKYVLLVSMRDSPEERQMLIDAGYPNFTTTPCLSCGHDIIVSDYDVQAVIDEADRTPAFLCLGCAQMYFPNRSLDSVVQGHERPTAAQQLKAMPLREII